ncbi:hypothetical protein C8R48DRAFT_686356 [Suillus tomentosus]|nr:hypothetical protein C8R48DRAFT_686356 [Suillus tomentosus]
MLYRLLCVQANVLYFQPITVTSCIYLTASALSYLYTALHHFMFPQPLKLKNIEKIIRAR